MDKMGVISKTDRKFRSPAIPHDDPIAFVVGDDIAFLEPLELTIRSLGWTVLTFPSAKQFLAHPRGFVPSCLILDVNLPDGDGVELRQHLAADRGHLPIIFISELGAIPATVKAIIGDAIEFLTKPIKGDAVLSAVMRAIDCSREALAQEVEIRSLQWRYSLLSRRQREVMAMVAAGWMNKQVSEELGISVITVKAHRAQTMRKMKAKSLAQLVTMNDRLVLLR
jgi:FixJ family two-component response regulator